ncbi:MAG: Rv3235 family protein, partial [Mycobacteriaceae bacterium]
PTIPPVPLPTIPPAPVVEPAARVGATRVLQLALEVEAGRRSPTLLRPLLSPAALDRVVARARECVRSRPLPGHLHPVHTQAVTDDVVEAFGRVSRGPRDHAVVARLERGPAGWICTILRLG